MAFNFNSINQALGQTNIFDPQSPMTQSGQTQTNVFRTSAPGLPSSPANPSGGVASPNVSARSTQVVPPPNQRAQAYAGVGTTDTTKAVGGIEGNIRAAQDKLQAKANEYGARTEAAKAENALSPDVVNKAIMGDDKAFQDTAARLSRSAPKPVDSFQGLKDEELPTLAAPLQYKDSWGEIFRPQAGPNFTAGQSNMEDLLLGRNRNFSNIASALGMKEDALIKSNDDMADSETKKAQDILNADFSAQTDAIRGQLSGASQSVIADAKAREAAEEARRAGLNPWEVQAEVFKNQKPYQTQLLRDSGLGDYTSLLNDSNAFNGLSDYIKLNQDVNYEDLITKDEASRFNRINGLLGNGEMIQAGKGTPADYTFDEQGGNAFIQSILGGKAKDQRALDEFQAQAKLERDNLAKAEAEKQAVAAEKARIEQERARIKLLRERLAEEPRGGSGVYR